MTAIGEPAVLAVQNFANADLGDARRQRRLVRAATDILGHPGGTLPQKIPDPCQLDALYTLVNRPEVTHDAVIASHCRRTLDAMARHPVVLIVHDGTLLDYSGLDIPQLGFIGNGNGRGFHCHNSLAVLPGCKTTLGLVHQILDCPRKTPKNETAAQARVRDKESRFWRQACEALPKAPTACLWVDVCDRAADVTEFLEYEERSGRKYLVRSQHNRKLGEPLPLPKEVAALHTQARLLPVSGRREIVVGAHDGRPARAAVVAVGHALMHIQPPRQPRGEHSQDLLRTWVVRVCEIDPPDGIDPVEWILLTNVDVATDADAWERVDWYCCRWQAEEFHKCQKTGCDIEKLQFTTKEALMPVIGLRSVVAVFLLSLRAAGRQEGTRDQAAVRWLGEERVRLLSLWRFQVERLDLTLGECLLVLARLGGHQNRPSDGPPGWQTLWHGWQRLEDMLAGARLRAAAGRDDTPP